MPQLTILTALQNDSCLETTVRHTLDLAALNPDGVKVVFVHLIPLAKTSVLPGKHLLDRISNIEAHDQGRGDLTHIADTIARLNTDNLPYELMKIERPGDLSELVIGVVDTVKPTLFVCGMNHHSTLAKWALGSFSQTCIDLLPCPVTVVKSPEEQQLHSH